MHQNERFQVWIFKNFLERGSPSPLPRPLPPLCLGLRLGSGFALDPRALRALVCPPEIHPTGWKYCAPPNGIVWICPCYPWEYWNKVFGDRMLFLTSTRFYLLLLLLGCKMHMLFSLNRFFPSVEYLWCKLFKFASIGEVQQPHQLHNWTMGTSLRLPRLRPRCARSSKCSGKIINMHWVCHDI